MNIDFPDFSSARVLVIGDVMLDSYWHGDASRISPESPVPVVHIQSTEERAGGAANVAINISAIGGNVKLLGLVGDDPEADDLEAILQEANVESYLVRTEHLPTINKLRVISRNQQLIRLDFEEKFHHEQSSLQKLYEVYCEAIDEVDVVIISDYGKGALSLAQNLIQLARSKGKVVLVDPKNIDFNVYRGASIITPNLVEFEAVVGVCETEEDLVTKAELLITDCDLEGILVTRGAQGMSLVFKDQPALHIPAKAREVFDVTGAGDTSIAILGAALAAGSNLTKAVHIANLAASVVVGKVGVASVSQAELRRAVQRQEHNPAAGILTYEELIAEVLEAKKNGEKIVMTNGCFDILHAGHVDCLEKARSLGDRLIVAVNDDASIARLKGPTRPLNSLAQRMLILSALRAVDWVVPFSADTPEELIIGVAPDILVKGGDWKISEIVGADFVIKNGGDVVTIPLVEGLSTTNLLNRIRT